MKNNWRFWTCIALSVLAIGLAVLAAFLPVASPTPTVIVESQAVTNRFASVEVQGPITATGPLTVVGKSALQGAVTAGAGLTVSNGLVADDLTVTNILAAPGLVHVTMLITPVAQLSLVEESPVITWTDLDLTSAGVPDGAIAFLGLVANPLDGTVAYITVRPNGSDWVGYNAPHCISAVSQIDNYANTFVATDPNALIEYKTYSDGEIGAWHIYVLGYISTDQ